MSALRYVKTAPVVASASSPALVRLGLATGRQQQYNGQATRRNAQAHTRR